MSDFISNYTQGFGTQTTQTGMTKAQQMSQVLQQNNGQVTIAELKPGEVFQGEIISVGGEEVQLALLNGQYLTARLEGQVQLAIGQLLNFQVQSNDNSKIVLKPVYQNLLQQQVGEAALKAANLPVNAKNMQLVTALIEQGLPIDKNALPQIYRQVLQHPESDLISLLKMYKLNLPITEENIEQYQHYKNLEHKLIDGMQEVTHEIQRFYDSLLGKTENTTEQLQYNQAYAQRANGFIEQVIQIFTKEAQTVNINENMTHLSQKLQGSGQESSVLQNNAVHQIMSEKEVIIVQTETQNNTFVPAQNQLTQEQLFIEPMQPKTVDDVLQMLEQNKLDMRALYELLQGNHIFTQSLTAQDRVKIYDSPAFRRLLQDTVQKDWMLTPQEVGEEKQVERLYQRLLQTSARLAETMDNAAQEIALQPKATQNLQHNLEFMNQMNQIFQYVQLPIKLSDSQAHGELYVYTNKKHLAQKNGILTALLHLDMEHLGSVDVHVSLQAQDNKITSKFFLEEDVLSLMEEQLESLNNRLSVKGYKVKTLVQARKETKTTLEYLEEQVKGTMSALSYQAFDIRA